MQGESRILLARQRAEAVAELEHPSTSPSSIFHGMGWHSGDSLQLLSVSGQTESSPTVVMASNVMSQLL